MDDVVMIEWVNKVLAPYVATAPDHVVPILILDMYRCHMMASVVQMIQELGHVARDKANAAAVDPIGYPNCCNCRLLFPLNHQLQFLKAHNHVLLQHFAANLVFLTRMALATHRCPYDLDKHTAQIDGLVKRKGHRRLVSQVRSATAMGGGFFVPDPAAATAGAGAALSAATASVGAARSQ